MCIRDRSNINPANSTLKKLPIAWNRKETPEMVPKARNPYTSAVNAVVSGAVAIQDTPATAANIQRPKGAGTVSNNIYPIPLIRYTNPRIVFRLYLSDIHPAPKLPNMLRNIINPKINAARSGEIPCPSAYGTKCTDNTPVVAPQTTYDPVICHIGSDLNDAIHLFVSKGPTIFSLKLGLG